MTVSFVAWIVLLLVTAQHVTAKQQTHILFVSVPWRGHVNPLIAIGDTLLDKKARVSFALPSECESWLDSVSTSEGTETGFEFHALESLSHIQRVNEYDDTTLMDLASSNDDSSVPPGIFEQYYAPAGNLYKGNKRKGFQALFKTLVQYQHEMYWSLAKIVGELEPSLMVVDSFTLAGIDVAKMYNITVVVNNPYFMLELDDPSTQLPASFVYGQGVEINRFPTTLLERGVNLYHRWMTRLDALSALSALESDIIPLHSRDTNDDMFETKHMKIPNQHSSSTKAQVVDEGDEDVDVKLTSHVGEEGDDIFFDDDDSNVALNSLSYSSFTYPDDLLSGSEIISALGWIPQQEPRVVLTNTVFGVEYPRSLYPQFVLTGPLIMPPSTKTTKTDKILSWLNKRNENGEDVAYVDLGQHDAHVLIENHIRTIVEGLSLVGRNPPPLILTESDLKGANIEDIMNITFNPHRVCQYRWNVDAEEWHRLRCQHMSINQFERYYSEPGLDLANAQPATEIVHEMNRSLHVLWSLPQAYRHLLPSNMPSYIKVSHFVPQDMVLAHPATRLFVTHGGLTGAQEALRHQVPLLVLPNFVDQWEVAGRIANMGTGLVLNRFNLTTEKVLHAADTILLSNEIHINLSIVKALMNASRGTQEAASVIGLCSMLGDDHLMPRSHMLDWYQRYFLDVYAIYSIILGSFVVIIQQCWTGNAGTFQWQTKI